MKKLILSTFITAIVFVSNAQSPQGINYQGVAYDNTGNAVTNQVVGIRFKILQGSASGPVLYEERQRPSTDNTGLFAVVIGNGTVLSGSFSSINWGSGTKWLQTGIDITGGNNYIVMGCSQFWSVPYAFYADNATHSQYADSSAYANNAAHAVSADNAGYAYHSGIADTALYAKTGFSSGSLTIPDGFNNATTVIITDSTNYTVPAGKNLYIPSSDIPIAINGDTVFSSVVTTGANARTFVGASENDIIWVMRQPVAAFLVDKKVEWKTFDLMNTSLTVPAGKQFVVVNTCINPPSTSISSDFNGGVGPNTNCGSTINGTACFIRSNTILSSGTVLSYNACPPLHPRAFITINGYLMEE